MLFSLNVDAYFYHNFFKGVLLRGLPNDANAFSIAVLIAVTHYAQNVPYGYSRSAWRQSCPTSRQTRDALTSVKNNRLRTKTIGRTYMKPSCTRELLFELAIPCIYIDRGADTVFPGNAISPSLIFRSSCPTGAAPCDVGEGEPLRRLSVPPPIL